MIEWGDLITLDEAGEIAGRAPVTLRGACERGTLEARKLGKTWVTTRQAVSAYVAYVAEARWASQPSLLRRPGGKPRRRRGRRHRAA